MVGVIGKAIKGFGKALKSKPKGKFSTFPSEIVRTLKRGVVDRNVKSKEVFKTIQGLRKKPYKGAKENLDKIYKKPKGKFSTFPSEIVRTLKSRKGKAFGKGALIGGAAASGLEYKRRKDRGDYKKGKK